MAIRNLRINGDEILRKKCKPVKSFDKKLSILLDDMYETLLLHEGVGLAAPQVGILKRVVIVDVGDGVIELINPEIISREGEQTGQEGCLSIPGEQYEITRPQKVTARAYDRNGRLFEVTGEDLLARALCHECEHLDGILCVDRANKEPKFVEE